MSFFRNKESYLGVDLGAGGIKIVELKKTKGRAQLWTYGIAEKKLNIYISEKIDKSPEDLVDELGSRKLKKPKKDIPTIEDPRVEEYANILKSLLKEAKVTTKQTTASLPVSYIFHTVLNLPKVEDKEIKEVEETATEDTEKAGKDIKDKADSVDTEDLDTSIEEEKISGEDIEDNEDSDKKRKIEELVKEMKDEANLE